MVEKLTRRQFFKKGPVIGAAAAAAISLTGCDAVKNLPGIQYAREAGLFGSNENKPQAEQTPAPEAKMNPQKATEWMMLRTLVDLELFAAFILREGEKYSKEELIQMRASWLLRFNANANRVLQGENPLSTNIETFLQELMYETEKGQ